MTTQTATIYLLDDDDVMRRLLKLLFQSAGYQVQEFASAETFFAQLPGPADEACLVLDMHMPDMDGLAVQKHLQESGNHFPIIFLTGYPTIPGTVKAMKGGAVDFLTKPIEDEVLLETVRQVLENYRPTLQEHHAVHAAKASLARLTPREEEVMRWLIGGKLNKEIAYFLGTSERTIKAHRAKIMEKIEITSVAELVWIAEKAGIVPSSETEISTAQSAS